MKDKIIAIIKSYSTEEEGRHGIYEHILEDFYEDMAVEIAALNNVASSQPIISESDKPKEPKGYDALLQNFHAVGVQSNVERTASCDNELHDIQVEADGRCHHCKARYPKEKQDER